MNDDVMRENYRAIGAQEKVLIEILKQRARELHDFIGSFGDTRELALAKTKIEEAVMWAVKHLTAP